MNLLTKSRKKKIDDFHNYIKNTTKVSIINLIYAYLSNRQKFNSFTMELKRNKNVGFHPSQLSHICLRQMGFTYLYEKNLLKNSILDECGLTQKVNKPSLEFIFDIGHIIHGLIQYSYLSDIENLDVSVENPIKKLQKKFWISGTNDIEIVLQDNKKWIVDIKTANFNSFNKMNKASDLDISYLVQLNLYMYGRGIKQAIVLFVNKNTSFPQMKEFFYQLDFDLIKPFLKKSLKVKKWLLQNSIEIDILPECKKLTGRYKNCPFSSICFRTKTNADLIKYTKLKTKEDYIKKLEE